jgi:hypothetical protein
MVGVSAEIFEGISKHIGCLHRLMQVPYVDPVVARLQWIKAET